MLEPQLLKIGPFFLPTTWLVLAVAAVVSVAVAERMSPFRDTVKPSVKEQLPTAILMFLFVYKFGPVLVTPDQVATHPASLFYSAGTVPSALCGLLIASVWLAWKWRKTSHVWAGADIFAVVGVLTTLFFNIAFKDFGKTTDAWWGWSGKEYRYHPLHLYRIVLFLPLFMWIVRKWKQLRPGTVFVWVAMWTGIVYLLTSLADVPTDRLVFGLTYTQWLSLTLTVVGLGSKAWRERAEVRGTPSPADQQYGEGERQ